MTSAGGRLQADEKTFVKLSYPPVVRFTGPVQLKGVRRSVEAYAMMVRLLARWAFRDLADLAH